MPKPGTARVILKADGLRLVRDRFLIGTGLYVLVISVVLRWVIPWVTTGVNTRWDFDLTPYHALIVSHAVVQLAPLLMGVLGAFLLLEGREDRTIHAMLVSPLRLSTYLGWLAGVMVVMSTVLTVVEGFIIAIALPPWPVLILAGFAGGLSAPLIALFVAGVASNKVEAFAYLKIVGVAPMVVTGMYFLDEPLQWLAAVFPPYWAVKAYWVAEAGGAGWPLWILGGVVVSALWAIPAVRLFDRAARR